MELAQSGLGALGQATSYAKESLHVPFLEETSEEVMRNAVPYLARLYRIFAKIFAKVNLKAS